jgi:hypothetical protein
MLLEAIGSRFEGPLRELIVRGRFIDLKFSHRCGLARVLVQHP